MVHCTWSNCTLHDLSSVQELDDAFGLQRLLFVMRHHHDGATVLLVQLLEQSEDVGTHLRVEVTCRLVGEDDFRIADDGAGDGDTLALTARELHRRVLHAVRESHPVDDFLCPTDAFAVTHPTIQETGVATARCQSR